MSSVPVVPAPTLQAQKSTWENHVDSMVKHMCTHLKQSMSTSILTDAISKALSCHIYSMMHSNTTHAYECHSSMSCQMFESV